MFGDPVINPKGWEVVPMKSVVIDTQYGTSLKANNNKKGLPILRMNNITYTGEIDINDIKWCDIPVKDEEKYTTKNGDLLFNRTNSPELVGKTAVWRSEEKYAIAGYLIRVRFKNDKVVSEYVSAYLNSSYGKKYLHEKAKPSINMSNFSASEFLKIPIMLPSLQVQKKFELFSNAVRLSIINLKNSLEQSNNLFNSLLQKAFRGEL
jgi:type I restriction enzyme S subunit